MKIFAHYFTYFSGPITCLRVDRATILIAQYWISPSLPLHRNRLPHNPIALSRSQKGLEGTQPPRTSLSEADFTRRHKSEFCWEVWTETSNHGHLQISNLNSSESLIVQFSDLVFVGGVGVETSFIFQSVRQCSSLHPATQTVAYRFPGISLLPLQTFLSDKMINFTFAKAASQRKQFLKAGEYFLYWPSPPSAQILPVQTWDSPSVLLWRTVPRPDACFSWPPRKYPEITQKNCEVRHNRI